MRAQSPKGWKLDLLDQLCIVRGMLELTDESLQVAIITPVPPFVPIPDQMAFDRLICHAGLIEYVRPFATDEGREFENERDMLKLHNKDVFVLVQKIAPGVRRRRVCGIKDGIPITGDKWSSQWQKYREREWYRDG